MHKNATALGAGWRGRFRNPSFEIAPMCVFLSVLTSESTAFSRNECIYIARVTIDRVSLVRLGRLAIIRSPR